MSRSIVRKIAAELFGEENSKKMIRSLDIIGDIVIVKIPEEFLDKKYVFGEKLLEEMPYIKVVLRQATPVSGVYRVRKLEHIAGEKRKWTVYKEYGIRIKVDVEKVYFSPRLSTERKRVADLVDEGEVIINMFAGAGPYSILIAKNKNVKSIHSIDINPLAVRYHLENIFLNKVEDKIILYRGDAGKIIEKYLIKTADRILMPLPEIAINYLKYAVKGLKDKGWIHIYLHIPYENSWREALPKAVEQVQKYMPGEWSIVYTKPHKVREIATRTLQVCVDMYIKRKNI